ncbi:MAG: hypothetical protein ACTSUE_22100 [Promethearchaeota archaeon]
MNSFGTLGTIGINYAMRYVKKHDISYVFEEHEKKIKQRTLIGCYIPIFFSNLFLILLALAPAQPVGDTTLVRPTPSIPTHPRHSLTSIKIRVNNR